MRGYPKHLNTKRDVINSLKELPRRTKQFLRRAIDGCEGWHTTERLESENDGIVNETHRVVDMGDEEEGVQEWYQQKWGPLPGNTLDRLGISLEEAQSLIEQAER